MPKGILAEFPNFSLNQPLKWLAKVSAMPTAFSLHSPIGTADFHPIAIYQT